MSTTLPALAHEIRLADERLHPELIGDKLFSANYGRLLLAESEGEQILLWTAASTVSNNWITGQTLQTNFVHGHFSADEQTRMHDNDFIATGSNLRDHQPDTLQIREEADRVTWSIKGRDFTGEPPIWRLSGSHAGVTTQLTYKALGPALWCWGPFARLSAGGRAGYEQLCTVEGTVQVDGKTYEIKNGYGVHERHEAAWTDTGDYMVDDIMGRGLYWQFGFSPEFSYYALTRERHPNFGYAVIDGKVYASTDPKKVQTEDVAFWDDPRTGFHVPYKWHTWMQTDDGIMDVHYTAYARACNVWVRPKGYCIYYWFLCRGSGSFRFADGRVVQSDNMMCLQNIDRTFLNLAHIGAYPGR